MDLDVNDVVLEVVEGDITDQPSYDAVVNAANARLMPGGGVAGAIHRAAGPKLKKECEPLAPIQTGEAVITNAYQLPNQKVIHVLGPVYGRDEPSDELLAKSYKNSLRIGEEHKLESIAFPAISTGAFGYPMQEAAEITLKTIKNQTKNLKNIKKIGIILYNKKALKTYKQKTKPILEKK